MAGRGSRELPMPELPPEDKQPKSYALTPEAARLVRVYLERVATALERAAGSTTYKSAHRNAAKIIRRLKPD